MVNQNAIVDQFMKSTKVEDNYSNQQDELYNAINTIIAGPGLHKPVGNRSLLKKQVMRGTLNDT